MRDERLRRLQREAADSGDLTAQTGLLLEHVRAGRLTPGGLELMAAAGHAPARAALGRSVVDDRALREWVWDLLPWGRALVVRVLVTAARAAIGAEVEGSALLGAAEAWCDCPCPRHAELAYRASRISEPDVGGAALAYHAVMAAHVAGHMKGEPGRRSLFSMVGILLRAAQQAGGHPEALRRAMQAEVVRCAWKGGLSREGQP